MISATPAPSHDGLTVADTQMTVRCLWLAAQILRTNQHLGVGMSRLPHSAFEEAKLVK
jgi:hypothetical protein